MSARNKAAEEAAARAKREAALAWLKEKKVDMPTTVEDDGTGLKVGGVVIDNTMVALRERKAKEREQEIKESIMHQQSELKARVGTRGALV